MDLTPVVERLDRAVLLLEHIAAATANPAATAAPGAQIEEGLWNAEQVAAYLKCSESKVYKAAEAGTLPCVRDGRSLRFEPEAIRAYIRGRARLSPLRAQRGG